MNAGPEAAAERMPAASRKPVGGLLRTRNFGLFWVGESVSGFGSAITTVALPLVAVSTLHASTGMVALLTAANWLPWTALDAVRPAGRYLGRSLATHVPADRRGLRRGRDGQPDPNWPDWYAQYMVGDSSANRG
jgi:hypothetical protein